MRWIGRLVLVLLISFVMAAMTAWGRPRHLLLQLARRRSPKQFWLAVFTLFGVCDAGWYLLSAKRFRPCFAFLAMFLLLVAWCRRFRLPGSRLGRRLIPSLPMRRSTATWWDDS